MPPAPMIAPGAEVAVLLTTAVIVRRDAALTCRSPAALIVESVIEAFVSAGCWPPNAGRDQRVAEQRVERCEQQVRAASSRSC